MGLSTFDDFCEWFEYELYELEAKIDRLMMISPLVYDKELAREIASDTRRIYNKIDEQNIDAGIKIGFLILVTDVYEKAKNHLDVF